MKPFEATNFEKRCPNDSWAKVCKSPTLEDREIEKRALRPLARDTVIWIIRKERCARCCKDQQKLSITCQEHLEPKNGGFRERRATFLCNLRVVAHPSNCAQQPSHHQGVDDLRNRLGVHFHHRPDEGSASVSNGSCLILPTLASRRGCLGLSS